MAVGDVKDSLVSVQHWWYVYRIVHIVIMLIPITKIASTHNPRITHITENATIFTVSTCILDFFIRPLTPNFGQAHRVSGAKVKLLYYLPSLTRCPMIAPLALAGAGGASRSLHRTAPLLPTAPIY